MSNKTNKKVIDCDKITIPDDFYDQDSKDFERASLEDFIDDETLEKVAERMYKQSYDEFGEPTWDEGKLFHRKAGFIEGAKWQAREMYTYDDIRFIAYNAFCLGQMDNPRENKFNGWIEQFKK